MNSTVKALLRRVIPDRIRTWRANRFRTRVQRVTARVVDLSKGVVQGGPFAGMRYISRSRLSQLGPKLLGTYEQELNDIVIELRAIKPDTVIDVGAAEGYYAVGLLRLIPDISMIAFETDPTAREDMLELARMNGVADRLTVRGHGEATDIEAFLGGSERSVVVMDIEGGEATVLDPHAIPAIRHSWILVELHPDAVSDIRFHLQRRFSETHRVTYLPAVGRREVRGAILAPFSPADLRAATWEARVDGQGWLWMEPRTRVKAEAPREDHTPT